MISRSNQEVLVRVGLSPTLNSHTQCCRAHLVGQVAHWRTCARKSLGVGADLASLEAGTGAAVVAVIAAAAPAG